MPEAAVYEERLVLYADVLGWRAGAHDAERLLAAVRELHEPAKVHNEAARAELREGGTVQTQAGPMKIGRVNPLFKQVQFGAFSDNFVFSVPASFGGRILGVAARVTVSLLRQGFLVRGGLTLGQLHHKDNLVFGPALNEAVQIEQEEAFYPRILISAFAAEHIEQTSHDPREESMILDQTGRCVVNPFTLPFDGAQELLTAAVADNFHPAEIEQLIAQQITDLAGAGRHKQAEKWRYLQRLIAGPIMDATPRLRRAWARCCCGRRKDRALAAHHTILGS